MDMSYFKKSSGFTLIELSIVLLIVSILIIPLFQLYDNYRLQQKVKVTKENIAQVASTMSYSYPNRVPCPSDRSLGIGNPNYGREVCALPNINAIPICTAALTEGICRTLSTHNALTRTTVAATNDWVIIGGIPTKNAAGAPISNLGSNVVIDGWGRKLNYAVSQRVMDTANASGNDLYKFGVINAIDENGTQTAGVRQATNNLGVPIANSGNAMFVVWSSGADGSGGFDLMGTTQTIPCDVTNNDGQNCNNDFIFRQGIGVSEGAGANYFDDISYFYMRAAGDLWANVFRNNAPTDHIYNLNTRNIGINTDTPLFSNSGTAGRITLDINGDLKTPTVRLTEPITTYQTGFPTIMSGTGLNGDFPSALTGLRIAGCNTRVSGRESIMWAWNPAPPSGNVVCTTPMISTAVAKTVTCVAPRKWVRGVTTNRCVICTDGVSDETRC